MTASSGARGLIKAALTWIRSPDYEEIVKEFLDYYQDHLADHSGLFPGVQEVLNWFDDDNSIVWGVVTNKHERFTYPLIEALRIHPHVVVCGDTLPERKPLLCP